MIDHSRAILHGLDASVTDPPRAQADCQVGGAGPAQLDRARNASDILLRAAETEAAERVVGWKYSHTIYIPSKVLRERACSDPSPQIVGLQVYLNEVRLGCQ